MDFRRPLRAVIPTLDGDVLAVLAGADEEFTGRQVHRLVGHGSERGVRNALDRLASQGVALSRPAGRAKLFRLNPDHLATPWIKGLSGMRTQLLQRLGDAVRRWEEQPTAVVLFGSVARGEASEDSDLDLFVVRPASLPPDSSPWVTQLEDLERLAHSWTGNDARILEFGEQELSADEAVLHDVLREGVAVVGSLRAIDRLMSAERSP